MGKLSKKYTLTKEGIRSSESLIQRPIHIAGSGNSLCHCQITANMILQPFVSMYHNVYITRLSSILFLNGSVVVPIDIYTTILIENTHFTTINILQDGQHHSNNKPSTQYCCGSQ